MSAREVAEKIFEDSGGRRLLEAYGIDAGDSPLLAFARALYPSKDGSRKVALAAVSHALLVASPRDGIVLRAGIAPPQVDVPGVVMLPGGVGAKNGRPTRTLTSLVSEIFEAPRPLLVYSQARSWSRALAGIAPTLDEKEILVSGEYDMVFDRARHDLIVDFAARHEVANLFGLQRLAAECENLDPAISTDRIAALVRKAGALIHPASKLKPAEKRAKARSLIEDLGSLPALCDTAAWTWAMHAADTRRDLARAAGVPATHEDAGEREEAA